MPISVAKLRGETAENQRNLAARGASLASRMSLSTAGSGMADMTSAERVNRVRSGRQMTARWQSDLEAQRAKIKADQDMLAMEQQKEATRQAERAEDLSIDEAKRKEDITQKNLDRYSTNKRHSMTERRIREQNAYDQRTDAEKRDYDRKVFAESQEYTRKTAAEKEAYDRMVAAGKREYKARQDIKKEAFNYAQLGAIAGSKAAGFQTQEDITGMRANAAEAKAREQRVKDIQTKLDRFKDTAGSENKSEEQRAYANNRILELEDELKSLSGVSVATAPEAPARQKPIAKLRPASSSAPVQGITAPAPTPAVPAANTSEQGFSAATPVPTPTRRMSAMERQQYAAKSSEYADIQKKLNAGAYNEAERTQAYERLKALHAELQAFVK